MASISFRFALGWSLVAAIVATGATAQNQEVYRYVDKEGRVVYSDRGPPSDAKDIQAKRMRGNVIARKPFGLLVQMQGVTGSLAFDELRGRAVEIGAPIDVVIASTDEELGRIELSLAP